MYKLQYINNYHQRTRKLLNGKIIAQCRLRFSDRTNMLYKLNYIHYTRCPVQFAVEYKLMYYFLSSWPVYLIFSSFNATHISISCLCYNCSTRNYTISNRYLYNSDVPIKYLPNTYEYCDTFMDLSMLRFGILLLFYLDSYVFIYVYSKNCIYLNFFLV